MAGRKYSAIRERKLSQPIACIHPCLDKKRALDVTGVSMVSSLVAAIAAIGAACTTAIFGHRTARVTADTAKKAADLEKHRASLRRAYRQVAAYYELENFAAEELSSKPGRTSKTVKRDLRDRVQQMGLNRPEMTRNECDSRVKELE